MALIQFSRGSLAVPKMPRRMFPLAIKVRVDGGKGGGADVDADLQCSWQRQTATKKEK
jgi:hypothetical protein